mmetsp:Transcript_27139/g.49520  ORF Transcript_27139/g.49520 Transcript_27139/m.49520 type:complete len:202 (+) Transcript_27139:109-714(+)
MHHLAFDHRINEVDRHKAAIAERCGRHQACHPQHEEARGLVWPGQRAAQNIAKKHLDQDRRDHHANGEYAQPTPDCQQSGVKWTQQIQDSKDCLHRVLLLPLRILSSSECRPPLLLFYGSNLAHLALVESQCITVFAHSRAVDVSKNNRVIAPFVNRGPGALETCKAIVQNGHTPVVHLMIHIRQTKRVLGHRPAQIILFG